MSLYCLFHAFSIPNGAEPEWLKAERDLKDLEEHQLENAEKILDAWEQEAGDPWGDSFESREIAITRILRDIREAFEDVVQCWNWQDWGVRFKVQDVEAFVLTSSEDSLAEWRSFEILMSLGLMEAAGLTKLT